MHYINLRKEFEYFMKKIIAIFIFCSVYIANSNAQKVYQEILRLSEKVAKDKTKDIDSRKIATFKVDELKYMAMKTREAMPDSSVTVLDNQAYAMYDFVNLYVKKLSDAKNKKSKENILSIFKNASIQNPRFNDMDLELVESYIRTKGYITQFSLDTDWIKAIDQARAELRKKGL